MVKLLTDKIETKANYKYYSIILCFILVIVSILFAFAPAINSDTNSLTWQVIMLKANDLTNSLSFLPKDSGLSKKVFRLTVPIFIRVFHLNVNSVLILQYILGYGILFYSYRLSVRILSDVVIATFIVVGMAFIYFGRAAFVDVISIWFDAWAFFFLVLTLYCQKTYLIFIFASFAAWTDERALIALPIGVLFHQIANLNQSYSFKTFVKINTKSFSVIVAIIGYLFVRYLLGKLYNMHTPISSEAGVSFSEIKRNIDFIPLGIWTFLEGFWIIIIVGIVSTFIQKDYFLLSSLVIQLLISTVVACCVYDITRSGAYVFPIVFVVLVYLRQKIDVIALKRLVFQAAYISFLFPAYYVISTVLFYKSIILTVVLKFLQSY